MSSRSKITHILWNSIFRDSRVSNHYLETAVLLSPLNIASHIWNEPIRLHEAGQPRKGLERGWYLNELMSELSAMLNLWTSIPKVKIPFPYNGTSETKPYSLRPSSFRTWDYWRGNWLKNVFTVTCKKEIFCWGKEIAKCFSFYNIFEESNYC